jgi:hypothetical protein
MTAVIPQEGMKINYGPFYSWVRMYRVGKITRDRFVLEWKLEQKEQRIITVKTVRG